MCSSDLIITSFFLRRRAAGFVTFVKSNAKALSTAFVYQKVPLRSPRRLWGVAPLSADKTPAVPPFEKGTLPKLPVSVCDDGDDVFATA